MYTRSAVLYIAKYTHASLDYHNRYATAAYERTLYMTYNNMYNLALIWPSFQNTYTHILIYLYTILYAQCFFFFFSFDSIQIVFIFLFGTFYYNIYCVQVHCC